MSEAPGPPTAPPAPETPGAPAAAASPDSASAPKSPTAPSQPQPLSDLQRKLGATVLAEAEPEGTPDEKVAWVYFTFVETRGLKEGGLRKLNVFAHEQLWFRVWMVALGDTRFAKDKAPIPGYSTEPVALSDYVGSAYFRQVQQKRADVMAKNVRAMYASPEKNPYADVTNQGSAGYGPGSDFNRADDPWLQARLYYWLAKCGELAQPPQGLTVEILTATNSKFQTVLINAAAITGSFKKHPEQRRQNVELYTAEATRNPPCKPKPAAEKPTTKTVGP